MKKFLENVYAFKKFLYDEEITLYAAYVSYYAIISIIPFLLTVLMLSGKILQINDGDVAFFEDNIPEHVYNLIIFLTNDFDDKYFLPMISFQSIALLWGASHVVKSVTKGLDFIFRVKRKHGFIEENLVGFCHTAVLTFLIALYLILLFVLARFAFFKSIFLKSIVSLCALTLILVWTYSHFSSEKKSYVLQIPGSIFTAVSWFLFSEFFALYLRFFSRASYIYGSFAAIIAVLIWIYAGTTFFFIGGKINFRCESAKNIDRNKTRC